MDFSDQLKAFEDAVVDGFYGACGRVLSDHAPDAVTPVLWLLLDHALLLLQAPVFLTATLFNDAGNACRRFSSLSPQDKAFLQVDPTTGVVVARSNADADGFRVELTLIQRPHGEAYAELYLDMAAAQRGCQRLLDAECRRVVSALRRLKENHPPDPSGCEALVIRKDVWERLFDRIGKSLDPIINEFSGSRFFPRDCHGVRRLFVAPRQPFTNDHWEGETALRIVYGAGGMPALYPYTARVFLTPGQVQERDGLSWSDVKQLLPLCQAERSVADTPLTSGIIDFGFIDERRSTEGVSREHYQKHGPSVAERKSIETIIYGEGADKESIFYVPIHIGGLPWVTLFSFHVESREGSPGESRLELLWNRFHIYRDLVPIIAEKASQAIVQAFVDALAETGREHLSQLADRDRFAREVTAGWREVCAAFPYGEVRLTIDSGDEVLELRRARQNLQFYLSISGERHVAFRMLTAKALSEQLAVRLQAAIEARRDERHTLMGLAAHEWVRKLSESISLSENVMEKSADLKEGVSDSTFSCRIDGVLDAICTLYGVLQSDRDLPWVMDKGGLLAGSIHFSDSPPEERDLLFLQDLFEFHARALLNAMPLSGVSVRYHFTAGLQPTRAYDVILRREEPGIAAVWNRIDRKLRFLGAPWPLDAEANGARKDSQSLLSALTLGPRELLRNGLRHGARGSDGVVDFMIDIEIERKMLTARICNAVDSTSVEKIFHDIRRRLNQLQDAIPLSQFTSPTLHDQNVVTEFRINIGNTAQ